ncbi:MAG: glucose-6-phosphate isomerase family protein [Patescibacteria group bacterium]
MEIDLTKLTPDIRKLNDMRDVVYDKEWLKNTSNIELYYMYRGVEQKDGLRYDITVIPAALLGSEFTKTKGHYHLTNWQEVYTALEGTAIYLMQKRNEAGEIEDAYAVKTEKGETIIIPQGYGHVTINPSETENLKMANWVSPDCKVDYLPYEKLQGACYYYILQPGSGQTGWIKNENYKTVPNLRFEKPLKNIPDNLEFLKNG